MLIAARGCLEETPPIHSLRDVPARVLAVPALALAFLVGAAGSSLLALVNGPVGPSAWTPALLDFTEKLEDEPVLAVVDSELAAENALDLVTWELRGREVCVIAQDDVSPASVSDKAFGAVVLIGELDEPLPVVGRLEELASETNDGLEYTLYRSKLAGADPGCPFVADGDRAEPAD